MLRWIRSKYFSMNSLLSHVRVMQMASYISVSFKSFIRGYYSWVALKQDEKDRSITGEVWTEALYRVTSFPRHLNTLFTLFVRWYKLSHKNVVPYCLSCKSYEIQTFKLRLVHKSLYEISTKCYFKYWSHVHINNVLFCGKVTSKVEYLVQLTTSECLP